MIFFSTKQDKILRYCVSTVVLGALLISSGCDLAKNYTKHDRSADMERQDFRDGLSPRDLEFENFSDEEGGVPPLESYVASVSDNLRPMPLVSLSVNQDIPLKNVLHDLAREADYDVELDPRITGSIIFTARNRPLDVVIERISEIAGLRYSFEDDILRVELDTPYTESYEISYLSIVRSSSSEVSNDISVVTGSGTNTGSKFSIQSDFESDFWTDLDENITQILTSNAGRGSLKTDFDPDITVVQTNPQAPVISVQPVDASQLNEGGAPLPTPGQNPSAPPIIQSPNVTLQVSSLPASSGQNNANDVDFEPALSINRQAGIISVYANEKIHSEVSKYLINLKKVVTSQVLIEAKILEITLDDEFSTGINWNDIRLFPEHVSAGFGTGGRPVLSPLDATNSFFLNYTSGDISTVVESVSRFGTVKALASPRLMVLNNQPAALNVSQNSVYFEIDLTITQPTVNTPGTIEVNSEAQTVPEGVLINVLPTINLEERSVTMLVRPTITRIVNRVLDPGVAFAAAQNNIAITSEVPELNVQEIDSILRMNSGEVAILGGLLQDRTDSEQEGIPVLGEIPLLGSLFRSQGDKVRKTELVIFLKATIMDHVGQSIHQTDRDLYKTFGQDRRPFKL